MCGRFSLEASWQELCAYFGLDAGGQSKDFMHMPPRYNIAPTQPIMMVMSGHNSQACAALVRWGLMPSWVKEPKAFTTLINARAETAAEKPSFKVALRHRRTLVAANGFYEWKRFGKGQKSQPYWVRPKQGGLVAFGGLMETWSDHHGSEVDTGCIISTDTNESFAPIHHRLPLVIHPKDFDVWLDCKSREPRDIMHLMQPVADDFFEAVPIGHGVNKVVNDGREIQNPIVIDEENTQHHLEKTQLDLF